MILQNINISIFNNINNLNNSIPQLISDSWHTFFTNTLNTVNLSAVTTANYLQTYLFSNSSTNFFNLELSGYYLLTIFTLIFGYLYIKPNVLKYNSPILYTLINNNTIDNTNSNIFIILSFIMLLSLFTYFINKYSSYINLLAFLTFTIIINSFLYFTFFDEYFHLSYLQEFSNELNIFIIISGVLYIFIDTAIIKKNIFFISDYKYILKYIIIFFISFLISFLLFFSILSLIVFYLFGMNSDLKFDNWFNTYEHIGWVFWLPIILSNSMYITFILKSFNFLKIKDNKSSSDELILLSIGVLGCLLTMFNIISSIFFYYYLILYLVKLNFPDIIISNRFVNYFNNKKYLLLVPLNVLFFLLYILFYFYNFLFLVVPIFLSGVIGRGVIKGIKIGMKEGTKAGIKGWKEASKNNIRSNSPAGRSDPFAGHDIPAAPKPKIEKKE